MWCAGVTILKPLEKPIKPASFFDALVPISVLICLLGAAVYLFGDNSSSGPNQIALLFATFAAALIGLKNGYTWKKLEEAMIEGITLSLGAILILLMVIMKCWKESHSKSLQDQII